MLAVEQDISKGQTLYPTPHDTDLRNKWKSRSDSKNCAATIKGFPKCLWPSLRKATYFLSQRDFASNQSPIVPCTTGGCNNSPIWKHCTRICVYDISSLILTPWKLAKAECNSELNWFRRFSTGESLIWRAHLVLVAALHNVIYSAFVSLQLSS